MTVIKQSQFLGRAQIGGIWTDLVYYEWTDGAITAWMQLSHPVADASADVPNLEIKHSRDTTLDRDIPLTERVQTALDTFVFLDVNYTDDNFLGYVTTRLSPDSIAFVELADVQLSAGESLLIKLTHQIDRNALFTDLGNPHLREPIHLQVGRRTGDGRVGGGRYANIGAIRADVADSLEALSKPIPSPTPTTAPTPNTDDARSGGLSGTFSIGTPWPNVLSSAEPVIAESLVLGKFEFVVGTSHINTLGEGVGLYVGAWFKNPRAEFSEPVPLPPLGDHFLLEDVYGRQESLDFDPWMVPDQICTREIDSDTCPTGFEVEILNSIVTNPGLLGDFPLPITVLGRADVGDPWKPVLTIVLGSAAP